MVEQHSSDKVLQDLKFFVERKQFLEGFENIEDTYGPHTEAVFMNLIDLTIHQNGNHEAEALAIISRLEERTDRTEDMDAFLEATRRKLSEKKDIVITNGAPR